jgi:hypothetical protein
MAGHSARDCGSPGLEIIQLGRSVSHGRSAKQSKRAWCRELDPQNVPVSSEP